MSTESSSLALADGPTYRYGKIPVSEYLRRTAARLGGWAAYIFYGRELTYGELDRLSDRFALWLAGHGIEKGDRVAVLLPTCPQVAIAFHGILKRGAVYVPINPMLKPPEIAAMLEDSGAKGLVALDSLAAGVPDTVPLAVRLATALADMMPETPTLPVSSKIQLGRTPAAGWEDFLRVLRSQPDGDAAFAVHIDDVACIIYSGGTTGLPKGCVHTHMGLLYSGACAAEFGWGLRSESVLVLFAPTFWVAGQLIGLIGTIVSEATCVLLSRWHAEAVMAAVDRYRATHTYLFVDSAEEILSHPDLPRYDLSSLRHTIVSSQIKQLNADVRARWRAATGSIMREAGWGLTETHTGDTTTLGFQDGDEDLEAEPIFCGKPVPGTQIGIFDFETRVPLPRGTQGEICVRSPSVLREYWRNPEATRQTVIDGWLHSGDIGKLDEKGLLHYLGRRKDMIKVRGMSVFPAEVERVLLTHPAVAMCGVVGRKDAHSVEVPVAFVLPADRADRSGLEAKLLEWCRERLANYKIPEIRLVDALPLTDTNKVKRAELARSLA